MADTGEQGRAIGYVRVSTLRQAEEGDSLANQTETITQYARGRGLEIRSRDVIIDDGVSAGIPIWERKGGKMLLKKIQTGRYSHVIVTKLDRMFRITSDAILTIDDLENMDVGFHIINMGGQSLDTTSAMGRFILIFIANVSELERGLISERTREVMEYKRRKGLRYTHSIYGWDHTDDSRMIPDWKEQARIDFMCWQIRVNGVSATRVARIMNKRGWKAKKGGKWYAGTVIKVTSNTYHGRRSKFPLPKWWGRKTWHRKRRGDEKVVAKVPKGVWDKDDLI